MAPGEAAWPLDPLTQPGTRWVSPRVQARPPPQQCQHRRGDVERPADPEGARRHTRAGDEGEAVRAVPAGPSVRERTDQSELGVIERVERLRPHDLEVGVGTVPGQRVGCTEPHDIGHRWPAGARIAACPYGSFDLGAHPLVVLQRHAASTLTAPEVHAHPAVVEGGQRKRRLSVPERPVPAGDLPVDRGPRDTDLLRCQARLLRDRPTQGTDSRRRRGGGRSTPRVAGGLVRAGQPLWHEAGHSGSEPLGGAAVRQAGLDRRPPRAGRHERRAAGPPPCQWIGLAKERAPKWSRYSSSGSRTIDATSASLRFMPNMLNATRAVSSGRPATSRPTASSTAR